MRDGPDLAAYLVSQRDLNVVALAVARFGPDGARERAEASVIRQIDSYVATANAWRLAQSADGARLQVAQPRRRA